MRTFLIIAFILSAVTFGSFWYLSSAAVHSYGTNKTEERFEVKPGDDIYRLSERLEAAHLISSRYAFMWHLAREGKAHKLVAGTYKLSGNLTIVEIAALVTEGKVIPRDIRITFPEGWDIKMMSERLTANALPGAEFLALATKPKSAWLQQYDFLAGVPAGASLEGFLFPDTYFFDPSASAESIIEKMLTNFGKKIDDRLRAAAAAKSQSLYAAITLASIVENEVRSEEDRKIVSDIFLRRLAIGQALQSDATVKYILGIDKIQHTFEETRVASPYNTYVHAGLPPGPIGNPGIISIQAVAFPESNPYFYFLSDPETGQSVFSVTFEEHVKNKNLHGL